MARQKMKQRKVLPDYTANKAVFLGHFRAGRFADALAVCQKLIARGIRHPNVYADAAVACVYLSRRDDAISFAKQAIALDPKNLACLDALAHAYGAKRDWPACAAAGRKALDLRAQKVADLAPFHADLAHPLPDADKDVIAFSLFGGDAKYCETAILNCLEQPAIYPGWICRFYVDGSVPQQVIDRLVAAGGEVIMAPDAIAGWPGPMWRFAAYDADDVRRVIFRDADSVISEREAGAVRDWIISGRKFHVMRDNGSHTELMLAGLWGATKGALPQMVTMVADFLREKPENAHFADQLFLRRYIWPFARLDLVHHDSVFGFMDGRRFPEGPHRDDFHVGYAEGSPFITITSSLPDGSDAIWELRTKDTVPRVICRYPGKIAGGMLRTHLPARYAIKLQTGEWAVHIVPMA